jgi:membrane protease YdiL (CAAX protease family)
VPWPPQQNLQPQPRVPQGKSQWEPQMVAHPHPEPRIYPLMLRTWGYRWWKPLVGILVLLIGGFLVVPLVLMPVLALAVALEGGSRPFVDRFTEASKLTSITPASMLYLNLTLASLTLLCMGIVRFVHRLRPRWLASVLPGMRWRFFAACFGLAIVALMVSVVVGYFLPDNTNEVSGKPNELTGRLIATAIVILVTTPLQALGEEYAFRGYLMQAFGSLTHGIMEAIGVSRKWAVRIAVSIALLVTSGLFALAHGVQNFPLFFDRFAFGLMAGLVVILVGGLEAGIALHILNNLLAFAVAIFFGDLEGALTVAEVSWWQLPVTIAQNGVYLLLVLLVARKMGLRNKTSPPVAQAAPERVG